MTNDATAPAQPAPLLGLGSSDGLGLDPERAAYARWLAATHAPALRRMDSDGAHAAGYAAGMAAERERCAKLCDELVDPQARYGDAEYSAGAEECARRIRGPNVGANRAAE